MATTGVLSEHLTMLMGFCSNPWVLPKVTLQSKNLNFALSSPMPVLPHAVFSSSSLKKGLYHPLPPTPVQHFRNICLTPLPCVFKSNANSMLLTVSSFCVQDILTRLLPDNTDQIIFCFVFRERRSLFQETLGKHPPTNTLLQQNFLAE